jgi:gliding motility-associated-like protein/uncharacterized repeat protein (TIGR01451 family)
MCFMKGKIISKLFSSIPRKLGFIAIWVLLGSTLHAQIQTITEESCGTNITYPVDGCSNCIFPETIIGWNYTITGSNQVICINASFINTLTVSGSNNIIKFCGNTVIESVNNDFGSNNTLVNTSGSILRFPAPIFSSGTQFKIVNYGTLNIIGFGINMSNKTVINVGASASINVNSDLTLNGDVNLHMLGGSLNVDGRLTLNGPPNVRQVCLNKDANISTRSITVNSGNVLWVDFSSASASCLRYTENAAVFPSVPLTNYTITICRGPGANIPLGSWGPNATVINNCSACVPPGKPDLVIRNEVNKICTDPVSGNRITLTVANEGTDKSTAGQTITATADISPLLSVVNVTAPGWAISHIGHVYTFTRTDELNAASAYPQILISVESEFGTASMTTAASVSYTGVELVTSNNTASSVLHTTPGPPTVVTPVVYCQFATAVPLTATGNNLMWYGSASGGTGQTIPPVPNTATAGTTQYYVSQNTGNCEGSRANISVIVTPLPAAPSGVTNQVFCQSQSPTVASLQVTGAGIQWYVTATGGTVLPSSQPLVSGTVYYASQTVGGCESNTRLAVIATINVINAPTGNSVQDFCISANPTVSSLQATGSTIQWYAVAAGGNPLAGTLALISGAMYYASQTVAGCESVNRLPVRANVFPVPSAASAGTDQLQYNSGIFTLSGNIPVTGTGQWSVLSGTAQIADAALPLTTATIAPNSSAVLGWRISSGVCPASADTVLLTYTRITDIVIGVTDGSGTYTPGTQSLYTINVKNNGPSDVTQLPVSNLLPQGILSSTWTASAQDGASVANTNGTGAIQELMDMPAGSSIVYHVTWDVPSSYRGNLVNTATITLVGGITDSNPGNNTSIDLDIASLQYSVAAVKTGPANIIAGASIEYRLQVTNTGPSDLENALLQDNLPVGIDNITWTAVVKGSATVNTAAGSGNPALTANLPAGSANSVELVIMGMVGPSVTGTLINTATVAPPGKPVVSSNTIHTVVRAVTGLQVIKTGPLSGSVQAGQSILYTIAVTNSGPSDAAGITITDNVPATINNVTWNASTQGNATVTVASGSGNAIQLEGTIAAGVGNTILLHINGIVASSATGVLTNTVSVTPAGGTAITADDGTAVINKAALTISKTGPANATAGASLAYSVVVENTGPSDATGVLISDLVSPSIQNVSWSVTATGAAVITSDATGNGNAVQVQGRAPAGSGFVVLINGTINPASTGVLQNMAMVRADGQDTVYSEPIQTTVTSVPVLRIVKTAPAAMSAGSVITYHLQIENDGLSDAKNIQVTDTLPLPITRISWLTSLSGSAIISDGATGNGRYVNLIGTIPAGAGNKISVVITGTIDSSYTGVLTNTGYVKYSGSIAAASQAATAVSLSPFVQILKTGPASLPAGQAILYTVRITNAGPSIAGNVVITDTLPPQVINAGWTAVASGNAAIISGGSGSGNIIHLRANIPASADDEIVVTVAGIVSGSYQGILTNTAYATDEQATVRSSSVATSIFKSTDLSIVKSGPGDIIAGSTIVYTLSAANAGPSDGQNVLITDTLPAQISNITWTAAGAGVGLINLGATGSGNILSVTGNIPAGNGIIVTITGIVDAGYTGTLTNTGYISAAGISAIASEPVATSVTVQPSVNIVKSGPSTIAAGELITYILKAVNDGPSHAQNVVITDTLPAHISNAVWTATGSGGAVIGTGNAGTGNMISVTGNIPAGADHAITLNIHGTVNTTYTGLLSNTAYVVADQQSKTASPPVITLVKNEAQLHINKSGPASLSAGSAIVYRIEVTNTGPSDAPGIHISDLVPAQITGVSWTTAASGTAVINSGATGTGNTIQINADIPGKGTDVVIITVSGVVNTAASGTISNTATATYGGITVTSGAVTTAISRVANLVMEKSGPSAIVAGQNIVYTVLVGNAGPSDAGIITISDLVPATIQNVTWTAVAAGSASISGTSSGTGNAITVNGTIPAGDGNTILVTIDGKVDPSAVAGALVNTATALSEGGAATATVSTSVSKSADLKIIQSGPADIAVNQSISYTLVITNEGPSNITGASVADIIPAQIGNLSFTISSTGSAGGTGSFTGNTFTGNVNLAAGTADSVIITIQGTAVTAATISNTATVTVPAGVTELNNNDNSSTVTTTVTNAVGILISKLGPVAVNAGGRIRYAIKVANTGITDAVGGTITDIVPAAITGVIWNVSISGNGGTTVNALSGTGNTINLNASIEGTVNGPGEITILVSGTVAASASGVITNTAVVDFGAARQSTLVTTVNNTANLRIIKAGPANIYAGQRMLYIIDISNAGPSDATGLSLSDIVPAQLQNVSWTAAATGSAAITTGAAGTGNTITVTGNLSAGTANRIRVVITGTVNTSYTGTLTNTASVTASGNTVVSAPMVTQVSKQVRLHVIKAGPPLLAAGAMLNYFIDVTNKGLSDATGITISDLVPAPLQNVSWTTTVFNGASVTAGSAGTGNQVSVTGDIQAGDDNRIRIQITGKMNASFSGMISNTASAVAPGETAVVSPEVVTRVVSIPLLKLSLSGPATINAGQIIVYTIDVTNRGPSDAVNLRIADVVPAEIQGVSWTAVVFGSGATITEGQTGTGNEVLLGGTISSGVDNRIQIIITGTVNPSYTGTLVNLAGARVPGNPSVVSFPVLTTVRRNISLYILKAGAGTASAGGKMEYALEVVNTGPSNAEHLAIGDVVPPQLQNVSWTSSLTGSGSIIAGLTGTGNSVLVLANLKAGAANRVRILITGTVDPAFSGNITNTASIIAPDEFPAVSKTITTRVVNIAALRIALSGPQFAGAGQKITYTLDVMNNGPSHATGINISDMVPVQLQNVKWIAVPYGNSAVTTGVTGSGNTVTVTGNIAAGAANYIRVVITGTINPSFAGTITNNAIAVIPGNLPVVSPAVVTRVMRLVTLHVTQAGPGSVIAGQRMNYHIKVTNTGSADAISLTITDMIPVQLREVTWAATVSGNSTITTGATGSGNTVMVAGNIAAGTGNGIDVVVNGLVDPAYTGTISNSVVVSVPGNMPLVSPVLTTEVKKQVSVLLQKNGPAAAKAGERISYSVVVSISGSSAAGNISISDIVPAAVTNTAWQAVAYGSATITGANNGTGNNIAFTANIPNGKANYIQININGAIAGNAKGTIQNTATATLEDATVYSSNTVSTSISTLADLVIGKAGPLLVFDGNRIHWNTQIANKGPSTADTVVAIATIPDMLTDIEARVIHATTGINGLTVQVSGNLVIVTATQVQAGATCSIEVFATIKPGSTGLLVISTTIKGVTTDPELENNSESLVTYVTPRAKLEISKTVTTSPPYAVGQRIRYAITVNNNGIPDVRNIEVTDTLPPLSKTGAPTILPAPAGSVAVYNAASNTISWKADLLPAGTSIQLLYDVDIIDSGAVVNAAYVKGDTLVSLPDTIVTTIRTDYLANLAIDKKLLTAPPYSVGKDIRFSIAVINNGPNTVHGTVVTDQLASNLDLVKDIVLTNGTTSYNTTTNTLLWNIGTLAPGERDTLLFSVRLRSGGNITNTATIKGDELDPIINNNSSSVTSVAIGEDDIWVPTAITPNGDGKNDRFVILGLNRYTGSGIAVYNRWGSMVYQSSNYAGEWDAKGLADGTYYYILKINRPSGMEVRKGWVMVVK